MNPTEQKQKFILLIRSALLQVEIPGPLKLILNSRINSQLRVINDNEIESIIKLALAISVKGCIEFGKLLGLEVTIETQSITTRDNRPRQLVRSNGERENDVSEISSGTPSDSNIDIRLERID